MILDANMDLAEDFIKEVINYALENCGRPAIFGTAIIGRRKNKPQAERSEMPLIEKLNL